VDTTNPTLEDRNRYIVQANAARFKIIGIEFRVPMKLVLERNASRTGKSFVPVKGILWNRRQNATTVFRGRLRRNMDRLCI